MTLPGIVSPSTGTTPESMSATVTPTPVWPLFQNALAFVASMTTWNIEPSSSLEYAVSPKDVVPLPDGSSAPLVSPSDFCGPEPPSLRGLPSSWSDESGVTASTPGWRANAGSADCGTSAEKPSMMPNT